MHDDICVCCVVAELNHTLPRGERIFGIATYKDKIYLLRWKGKDHVEVYDTINFALLLCLQVPHLRGRSGMTLCQRNLCLYIGDNVGNNVHRVELNSGSSSHWPVHDEPAGLSVSIRHHVLVTCKYKIKEFSSHGNYVSDIILPEHVSSPWHAVQLRIGELIVCHGDDDDPNHCMSVCKITDDDPNHSMSVCKIAENRSETASQAAQPSSGSYSYKVPYQLALDSENEFVFVADRDNQRVMLLSPSLSYIRDVVSRGLLTWGPSALCLDIEKRRMYVADSEVKDGEFTPGQVHVFNI